MDSECGIVLRAGLKVHGMFFYMMTMGARTDLDVAEDDNKYGKRDENYALFGGAQHHLSDLPWWAYFS